MNSRIGATVLHMHFTHNWAAQFSWLRVCNKYICTWKKHSKLIAYYYRIYFHFIYVWYCIQCKRVHHARSHYYTIKCDYMRINAAPPHEESVIKKNVPYTHAVHSTCAWCIEKSTHCFIWSLWSVATAAACDLCDDFTARFCGFLFHVRISFFYVFSNDR